MYKFFYILKQSFVLLNRMKKGVIIAVIFMSIGFVTIGSSYIFGRSFFESSLSLRNKVDITVFFKKGISYNDVLKSVDEIKAINGVSSVNVITSEEAKEMFIKMFPQYKGLLSSLDQNPFPYTAKVQMKDLELGSNVKSLIESFPTVDMVVFSQEVAKKVNNLAKVAWMLFVFVFIVVIAEFIFISQSIISFLVDLRKDELKVLHLIGADPLFVNLPFIIVVLFIVLVSWGLSMFILQKVDIWSVSITRGIIPFSTYSPSVNVTVLGSYLLLFGIFISLLGGIIPLRKVRAQ